MTVIVALFESTITLSLTLSLANFVKVYWWQRRVLPVALNFHTYIVKGSFFDPSR